MTTKIKYGWMRDLIEDLEFQQWRVELRKAGHFVVYPPDKKHAQVVFASTPSHGGKGTGRLNVLTTLRRAGYVPTKK